VKFSTELHDALILRNRRALARLITLVENEDSIDLDLLDHISKQINEAHRIGVTGAPGAGKSTLVDLLTKRYRKQGKTVGIIAVDPTSPFTGGALLGDRIRMTDVTMDEGVFIRSMASRGSLGGLATRTNDVADLMDAFGMDLIIIETVGVGQSELDVVKTADTTLVLLVPESGDGVQAMKAGLMEIADVFVLNKADREGADRAVVEIESILKMKPEADWSPPVLKTIASSNEGLDAVSAGIDEHRSFLQGSGRLAEKQRRRISGRIHSAVRQELEQAFWTRENQSAFFSRLSGAVDSGESPYRFAADLLREFRSKLGE